MPYDKNKPLHATYSIDGEVSDNDTRFLRVTINLMHTGANRNGSYFSKQVVDKYIDTIYNTPILGFIEHDKYTGEDDFKGHEYDIKKTDNGYERYYKGQCFGVIPESCNPRWVSSECEDGEVREFLQVDGLMWEKFSDATGIMKRDTEKHESMELYPDSIDGYEDETDGLFHFTSFSFDGACLLGSDVTPAMVDAGVAIKEVNFSMDEFAQSVRSDLNDKFAAFTKLLDEESVQGGVGNMPNPDFSQTIMQQFEDIALIVREHETYTDEFWGMEVSRFYATDVQDDEVIVVDTKDNYHYYGVPFTMEGDKPVLDFACAKRKKVTYSDYEDGTAAPEGAFDFGQHISEIEGKFTEKVNESVEKIAEAESAKEQVEAEFEAVKAEFDEMKPKYEELFAADEQRKADELNAEKDAKLGEYEDSLGENEAFAAIKDKKDELSVDEIEKECAVLYVKQNRAKAQFSKVDDGDTTVGVIDDHEDMDGYVNTKYGYIKVNR